MRSRSRSGWRISSRRKNARRETKSALEGAGRPEFLTFLLTSTALATILTGIQRADTPGGDGFSVPSVILIAASSEVENVLAWVARVAISVRTKALFVLVATIATAVFA